MSRKHKSLKELISLFGEPELTANKLFKKTDENVPAGLDEELINCKYEAKLCDVTSDYSRIKRAFNSVVKKSDGKFVYIDDNKVIGENIRAIVKISIINDIEHGNICVPASLGISLSTSGKTEIVDYIGGTEVPAFLLTNKIKESQDWLENTLTADNILRNIVQVIKSCSADISETTNRLYPYVKCKE